MGCRYANTHSIHMQTICFYIPSTSSQPSGQHLKSIVPDTTNLHIYVLSRRHTNNGMVAITSHSQWKLTPHPQRDVSLSSTTSNLLFSLTQFHNVCVRRQWNIIGHKGVCTWVVRHSYKHWRGNRGRSWKLQECQIICTLAKPPTKTKDIHGRHTSTPPSPLSTANNHGMPPPSQLQMMDTKCSEISRMKSCETDESFLKYIQLTLPPSP